MSVLLNDRQVTTKKPHNCWGCTWRFPSGTLMHYEAGVNDCGDFYSCYWCLACYELLEKVDWAACDDGLGYGDLMDLELDEEIQPLGQEVRS